MKSILAIGCVISVSIASLWQYSTHKALQNFEACFQYKGVTYENVHYEMGRCGEDGKQILFIFNDLPKK